MAKQRFSGLPTKRTSGSEDENSADYLSFKGAVSLSLVRTGMDDVFLSRPLLQPNCPPIPTRGR